LFSLEKINRKTSAIKKFTNKNVSSQLQKKKKYVVFVGENLTDENKVRLLTRHWSLYNFFASKKMLGSQDAGEITKGYIFIRK